MILEMRQKLKTGKTFFQSTLHKISARNQRWQKWDMKNVLAAAATADDDDNDIRRVENVEKVRTQSQGRIAAQGLSHFARPAKDPAMLLHFIAYFVVGLRRGKAMLTLNSPLYEWINKEIKALKSE